MRYQVTYMPRVQNELCVGEYKTQMEAEQHIDRMKPRLKKCHYIKVIEDHESILYEKDNDEMTTNFQRVKEFMKTFGQEVKTKTEWPSQEVCDLRFDLIHEELNELEDAMYTEKGSLVDVADALTDLLVVVYGAGHAFGIDLDECFKEVHRSNMSKLGEDGKPIYREDGKVLKGPNYSEPDLKGIVNE